MRPGQQFYKPMSSDQRTAHEKFVALNRFVTARNGWIVNPPGDKIMRLECLPSSTLPSCLAALGYEVIPTGEGQRMLATAITERFTRTSSGAFEPMTENSTKPVAATVTHAGIIVGAKITGSPGC